VYGVINKSLKDMVIEQFGTARWTSVLERSGVPTDSFLTMRSYDDQRTYALAQACADELGISLADALRAFGAHWVEHTLAHEYSTLVTASGNTLIEFLENLNALHDKISSTFLDYQPPEFDVTVRANGELEILYTSQRTGLTPFVEGLMLALGKRFGEPVEVLNIESIPVTAGEQSRFTMRRT
jgi:hypothetical protein